MKKGFFITTALAGALLLLLTLALQPSSASATDNTLRMESSCPEIPVSGITGCLSDGPFGCLVISTSNGRTFALEGQTSGLSAGDYVSVSGNIVPDSDCGCAIVVSSSSVTGSC